MNDTVRDDDDRPGDRKSPKQKQAKLSSPRADAFGNGRQFRWTETADDPFDKGKYWDIYDGTD
jgi:hypothetical protein